MKYKGRKLTGPQERIIPIIRGEKPEDNIILKVRGIVDLEEFDKICPQPEPAYDILPGNKKRLNLDSPRYQQQMEEWLKKRTYWMTLKSLEGSDIEWEVVKMNDPETWHLWMQELKDAGFVDAELGRIIRTVQEVNSLNESLIEEARQSFLRGAAEQPNGQSSQPVVPPITPSGEPAKPSA